MRKVPDYADSAKFEKEIPIFPAGDIPKYHFVRCAEVNKNETSPNARGIRYGPSRYKRAVEDIPDGEESPVDRVIHSFAVRDMSHTVRIECYRALTRSPPRPLLGREIYDIRIAVVARSKGRAKRLRGYAGAVSIGS